MHARGIEANTELQLTDSGAVVLLHSHLQNTVWASCECNCATMVHLWIAFGPGNVLAVWGVSQIAA